MVTKPDFSLILPCYNESPHIYQSVAEITSLLELSKYNFEIILIDDKSQDDTVIKIKKITQSHKNIRSILHLKNIGRGGTVAEGILAAKSDIVGYIDIDLEVAPDYISHFVKTIQQKEADVVIAYRIEPFRIFPFDLLLRIILSRGYAYLAKFILKLPVNDSEAGYKFFYKPKILPVLRTVKDKHWFWDSEITARSVSYGLRIKEIPVLFLKNTKKKSTVRLIPDIIAYIKALYNYKTNSSSHL